MSLSLSLSVFRVIFSIVYISFLFYLYLLKSYLLLPTFQYILPFEIFVTFFILFGYKYNIFKYIFFIVNVYVLYQLFLLNNLNIYTYAITFRFVAIFNILIVILPLNATLSIDKLLSKKTNIVTIHRYNYTFFAVLVSLIYLDGAIYKSLNYQTWIIDSDMFFYKVYFDCNDYIRDNFIVDFILNHPTVAQILTLTTYFYQLSFIFVIFLFKKIKKYFLFLGFLLHFGMGIFFDFSYVVLFTLLFYIPLINSRVYYKIFAFFRTKPKKIRVVYDNSCHICSNYIYLIKSFDFSNKISLVGKNLSNYNEIIVHIGKDKYLGVEGFKYIFKNIIFYYPFYLTLTLFYKSFNDIYLYIAKKRKNFKCNLSKDYIKQSKAILILYISISIIGLTNDRLHIISSKYYLYLSAFSGTIYPVNVFIIREKKYIKLNYFYIEDSNKNKIFLTKIGNKELKYFYENVKSFSNYNRYDQNQIYDATFNFKELKYTDMFLLLHFKKGLKNDIFKDRFLKVLKLENENLKLCKGTMKFYLKDIKKIKSKKELDELLKKQLNPLKTFIVYQRV